MMGDKLRKRILEYTHITSSIEICKHCQGRGYDERPNNVKMLCNKCDGEGRVIQFVAEETYSISLNDEDVKLVNKPGYYEPELFNKSYLDEAIANKAKDNLKDV